MSSKKQLSVAKTTPSFTRQRTEIENVYLNKETGEQFQIKEKEPHFSYPKKRKKVLPEEIYQGELEKIIENTYYPDIHEAKKILGTNSLETAEETLGLYEFQELYTGEDNASFEEVMDHSQTNRAFQQKFIEDGHRQHLLAIEAKKRRMDRETLNAIEMANSGTGQALVRRNNTRIQAGEARNSLFFPVDNSDPPPVSNPDNCIPENTRFKHQYFSGGGFALPETEDKTRLLLRTMDRKKYERRTPRTPGRSVMNTPLFQKTPKSQTPLVRPSLQD